jgi:hypothetical protein
MALARVSALCLVVAASAQPLLPAALEEQGHEQHDPQLFVESTAAGGPEQLWVALGATPDAVALSWLTNATGAQSLVRWGLASGALTNKATGAAGKPFVCGSYTSGAVHIVNVSGLPLATRIFYTVGDDATGVSSERSFVTSPGARASYPYVFGITGDPGQTNNSNATFNHLAANPQINSVFIPGDLSYADSDMPRWDSWGRLVDPLASTIPTMVASGNHGEPPARALAHTHPLARRTPALLIGFATPASPAEIDGACLYTAYQARYANMPSTTSDGPLYYSYEVAGAHVIILASFFVFSENSAQYNWLVADLKNVDRSRTPWLIVLLHAPWYTSNTHHPTDGQVMMQTLEPLLHAAHTNVVFAGHVHAYERNVAVFNGQADPTGAVHITIGDGGNREGLYDSWVAQPAYSAFRAAFYGHGELTLVNDTHARFAWLRNDDGERVEADSAWITQ